MGDESDLTDAGCKRLKLPSHLPGTMAARGRSAVSLGIFRIFVVANLHSSTWLKIVELPEPSDESRRASGVGVQNFLGQGEAETGARRLLPGKSGMDAGFMVVGIPAGRPKRARLLERCRGMIP